MTLPAATFDKQKFKAYYNTLKVEHGLDFNKAEDRAKYVRGLHGGTQAVDRLQKAIELQEAQGVFLFTGQRGSGKSTELQRLKHQLENNAEEPCKVFYLDMEHWLNPSREIELGAFMLAVVAAWVEQANLGAIERTWFDRIAEFLTRTHISVDKLSLGADVAVAKTSVSLALRTDDSFLSQLANQVNANRNAFVRELHQFAQDFKQQLCPHGQKCVLLIDSLEKLTGVADKAEQVYESVLQLFSQQSEALKLPLVHVVYSIAPYVLNQNRQLPALLGGAIAVQLPSVHVFQRNSYEVDDGVDQILELLNKRCPDWREFFDEADVRAFACDSGGDLRDFMRGLQVCMTGLSPQKPRVDGDDWAYARSQIKPNTAIDLEHMRWMAKVDQSHAAELSSPITPLVLERYLSTKHVLAYLNGDTWYGLHPLIRNDVLARTKAPEHASPAAQA
ncbi:hypothetical protein [Hydrogenophaga soli]